MILECWDSEPDNRPTMNKVVYKLNAIVTNKIENDPIINDESNLQSSEQQINSSIGDLSQLIQNFHQMNVEELNLNNETSNIIYDDTIDSLTITDFNKDILNVLGGLQRYRKLKVLDCKNTQIFSLPSLPDSLTILNFRNTKINNLSTLPNYLIKLICSNT